MAAIGQLQFFLWAATDQFQFFCGRKHSKSQSKNIQILKSLSHRFGDVQVIF